MEKKIESKDYITERLSKETIELLNDILEIIIKEKIANKTFKIHSLVGRRLMSFDEQIYHIATIYKELTKDKKILKMIKKINKCYI